MIRLSASIRSKPDWWKKYRNPDIRAKWKSEALATQMYWQEQTTTLETLEAAKERLSRHKTLDKHSIVRLNERQVTYVLDELARFDALRDEATGIQVRIP